LRRAWLTAATPERVMALADKLFELALAGEVRAARVWLEHVIGKPPQAVEVFIPEGKKLTLSDIVSVINKHVDEYTSIKIADAFAAM
jgi:hypothetical protein